MLIRLFGSWWEGRLVGQPVSHTQPWISEAQSGQLNFQSLRLVDARTRLLQAESKPRRACVAYNGALIPRTRQPWHTEYCHLWFDRHFLRSEQSFSGMLTSQFTLLSIPVHPHLLTVKQR